MKLLTLVLVLTVFAVCFARGAEPHHADYANPPQGSWGVAWCGNHGVIWVQDHNHVWWRFSSEDGTGPDPDDAKGVNFFNEWLQSGPTDVVQLKNVACQ